MKHVLPSLIFLCSFFGVNAQSTTYTNRMNQMFGAIDKTKVTTGYLKEFGVRLNRVESYNGTVDSTNWVDVTQWQSLYTSLYSMRVGMVAASMTKPSTVFTNLKTQQAADPGVILLAALYYPYQQYKTNAYTGGDVTITNGRIYDVPGRNPYDTKKAFAVAPMNYSLEGNTFSFKLQSNMVYTNTSLTLNAIEIDFGNGLGYQTVSMNSVINVSYNSSGEKEMKVKFAYNGGVTLYSHSKLYVNYIPSEAQARFSGSGAYAVSPPIVGAPYLGISATGSVIVETAGTDGVLDKPLIVVEGFDPDGRYNYTTFITSPINGGINVVIDEVSRRTLNQAIEDEGYDLVFINFSNGTDYIQRNAYFVEAVIEWVNSNKDVGAEKNVVLGMSMGGLVARYALRHMETTSRVHDTKLYISHDAPHQGANVPVAFQAFVRHLSGESISWPVFLSLFTIDLISLPEIAPALNDGLALLQSPAAQQMLTYQLSGTGTETAVTTNPLRTSFDTEYRELGYPTQGDIRSIAISNGSECGSPLEFGPYSTLASVNMKIDLPLFTANAVLFFANLYTVNPIKAITSLLSTDTDVKAEFSMKALPNHESKEIYKGRIFIKKEVLWVFNSEDPLIPSKALNSTTSMLPIDNAGGGVYDLNRFITLPASMSQFILQKRFNFVPTYSSLDIGAGAQPVTSTELTRVYSPLVPPVAPKNTPFHNFFTNPTISENHVQFTLNNGNWLLDELDGDGTPAFYSCASSCAAPPALSISGASLLCTSSSFSLANVSPLATTTWQANPPSLFTASSGTGSSTSLQAASVGQGTLTYTVSTGCGQPMQKSTTFWVGKPMIDGSYNGQLLRFMLPEDDILPYNLVCNGYYTTCNMSFRGSTSGNWQKMGSNPSSLSWSQSGNDLNFYFWAVNQTSSYRLTTSNACGTTTNYYYFKSIDCSGGGGDPCEPSFSVSPNPSSETVNIVVPNVPPPCESVSLSQQTEQKESKRTIKSIALHNSDGELKHSQEFKNKKESLSLDISDLPKGIYILKISDGTSIETHRIVKD